MERLSWIACGLAGASAVAAGAFGAHGLKNVLEPDMLAVFRTAAHYHQLHAVGLGLVALAWPRPGHQGALGFAGVSFVVGILLFSGSLYTLAISGARWLGAVTPLGGVAFIAGWLALSWAGMFARRES